MFSDFTFIINSLLLRLSLPVVVIIVAVTVVTAALLALFAVREVKRSRAQLTACDNGDKPGADAAD